MEVQHTVTARKRHRCDSYRCGGAIEPGQRYVRSVAFPGSDFNYGRKPIVARGCLDCSADLVDTQNAPPMRRRPSRNK